MFQRLYAMINRYVILVIGSGPRMMSIFYWPSIQIILWGFFSNFLLTNDLANSINSISFLLSAIILWDVLFRAQLGLSMTFFEELWSRNLGHLLITPIKTSEIILSLVITSFLRTSLGLIPAIFMASYYFDLQFFKLGFYLVFFLLNLIFVGWSIGFVVSGLVLRYGQAFEELAWAFIFVLLPFSCVYYPLEALPDFFQIVALLFPPAHIFEGMRQIIENGFISTKDLITSFLLNILYFLLATLLFKKMMDSCRKKGNLFNLGE
tara:strand:- start:1013 stop:1804 length:792 start_codon:yes stop_codon:yes gene_type:complete